MSKLEEQKALPRRKLFRSKASQLHDINAEIAQLKFRPIRVRKAKKAKRK